MRITDIIGDWLIELPIVEQALKRSDTETRVSGTSQQVIIHLIKVLKWKDPYTYTKHISDLDGWLKPIYLLKMKQGYPKQEDYYNWMFADLINEHDIDNWVSTLFKYNRLPVLRTNKEVYAIIESVMKQLSIDFAARLDYKSIENYLPPRPE
jgi:hypothetical protein